MSVLYLIIPFSRASLTWGEWNSSSTSLDFSYRVLVLLWVAIVILSTWYCVAARRCRKREQSKSRIFSVPGFNTMENKSSTRLNMRHPSGLPKVFCFMFTKQKQWKRRQFYLFPSLPVILQFFNFLKLYG